MHTNLTAPAFVPILAAGRHRTPARGACFMEYASYLAGERWSDRPECTHPLLAALARDVNDLVSDAGRDELLPHVHRVVGLNPADPTYWAVVAAIAASEAMPVVSLERQRALGVGLLALVRRVDTAPLRAIAREAFDSAPDTERWARQYVDEAPPVRGDWRRAADAMTHTAAVGVALACIDDPDPILRAMLVRAIDAGEAVRDATPTRRRVLVAG